MDIQVRQHKDFNKNSIKNARIPDVNSGEEHDEDAINRKFVEEKLKVKNLSATTTVNDVGGIPAGTDIDGKTVNEILDEVFNPLIAPTYTKPTVQLSIQNLDELKQSGKQVDVVLEAIVTLNDSEGITSYTFSGSGINTPVVQAGNIFTVSNFELLEGIQSWDVNISYQGSVIKEDSHGNDDNTGIFGDANDINSDVSLDLKPPILTNISRNSGINFTSMTDVEILESVPNVLDFANKFYLEIDKDVTDINFALPLENADIAIMMDGEDISSAFDTQTVSNIKPWGVGSGFTYTVFNMNTTSVLTEAKTLEVVIFEKTFDSINDIMFSSTTNEVSINGESALVVPNGDFDVYKVGTNQIRIVSNVGFITKVEHGRPFKQTKFYSNDVTIDLGIEHSDYENITTNYKFRVWVVNSLTPTQSTKIIE
ncbi:hypothetical protein BPT24_124 [Tenacibaculum phage pT24]|uniref:Uncharacterized protein n=1 Tax=Tenacibaculum phage pT24 TaxID=1880590 RepID=A0A1B4XWS6_9CAUD|nr:hypothetical protein HYP10_gp124 [Tenacibaculum phage pT24]BAV39249.1 hypothetical protein BPT24_124 [Tenacibaculum phage pT24]